MAKDGELVAVGSRDIERAITDGEAPHVHALATRWSPEGALRWSKSYPFGPLPGSTSIDTRMMFFAVVANDDGSVDALLQPPRVQPHRIVRLEADASISRIQLLEKLRPSQPGLQVWADTRVDGQDLSWRTGDFATTLAKIRL